MARVRNDLLEIEIERARYDAVIKAIADWQANTYDSTAKFNIERYVDEVLDVELAFVERKVRKDPWCNEHKVQLGR